MRPIIRAGRIATRVKGMGRALTRHYAGRHPLALVVMDGAAFFACDLLRSMAIPDLQIHFMGASSYYGGRVSSGQVTLSNLPACDGEEVLLIDDILDSGHTLSAIRSAVLAAGARDVRTCVLLDKPAGRQVPFQADLVGFTVPNHFLVGYGLDLEGRLRQLPDICALDMP